MLFSLLCPFETVYWCRSHFFCPCSTKGCDSNKKAGKECKKWTLKLSTENHKTSFFWYGSLCLDCNIAGFLFSKIISEQFIRYHDWTCNDFAWQVQFVKDFASKVFSHARIFPSTKTGVVLIYACNHPMFFLLLFFFGGHAVCLFWSLGYIEIDTMRITPPPATLSFYFAIIVFVAVVAIIIIVVVNQC